MLKEKRRKGSDVSWTRASQIAEEIGRQIHIGRWPAGSWLPTTRELAEQFGVSRNTVQEAIQELGQTRLVEYQPRRGARVRAKLPPAQPRIHRNSHMGLAFFGALPPDSPECQYHQLNVNSWAGAIAIAMQGRLLQEEIDTRLTGLGYRAEVPEDQLRAKIDEWLEQFDAMALMPGEAVPTVIEAFKRAGKPCVALNRPSRQARHNFVTADDYEGGRRLGALLARMGIRNILAVTGELHRSTEPIDRVAGMVHGLMESHASIGGLEYLALNVTAPALVRPLVAEYLQTHTAPQFIIAEHDNQAIGAIQACRDHGLNVPGDVGVMGATGLATSADNDPPLSVICQPLNQMGIAAAEMLIRMLRTGERQILGMEIPPMLVMRQSFVLPPELAAANVTATEMVL